MKNKKTFVLSDIHGSYKEFMKMLKNVNFKNGDKLIMLGDYIDRGKDSYNVVKTVQSLQKKYGKENVIALRGNHEQMLIDSYNELTSDDINKVFESSYKIWHWNGGDATVISYKNNDAFEFDDIDWFLSLPTIYEDDNFIYVHAGLRPNVSIEKQKLDDKIWIREEFYEVKYDFGKTVIFGHTPFESVTKINGYYAIDTGVVFKNKLSALEIVDGVIKSVYEVKSENYDEKYLSDVLSPKETMII
jgi:serine/threonine protein phosphatase 1